MPLGGSGNTDISSPFTKKVGRCVKQMKLFLDEYSNENSTKTIYSIYSGSRQLSSP